jgi:hypothetical protein
MTRGYVVVVLCMFIVACFGTVLFLFFIFLFGRLIHSCLQGMEEIIAQMVMNHRRIEFGILEDF